MKIYLSRDHGSAKQPMSDVFPYFMCIGSQKAGTGWVFSQFRSHRDFCMPLLKELHFFTKVFGLPRQNMARKMLQNLSARGFSDSAFEKQKLFLEGVVKGVDMKIKGELFWQDFDYYKELFKIMGPLSGDVTPSYMKLQEDQVQLIAKSFPKTRFFLIVRNPSDRLWSHMQMHARKLRGNHFLHANATTDIEEFKAFSQHKSVTDLSFVSTAIENYRKHMGDKRFKVLFFDDLRDRGDEFRSEISRFLDVDPSGFTVPASVNVKAKQEGKISISNDQLIWMANYFAEEYEKLADLLGGHAKDWQRENNKLLLSG